MGAGLALGATGIVMMRFDVEQMLHLVDKYRMTNLFLAPPAVLAMANVSDPSRFDTSSVRVIHSGAAPLAPEVGERVKSIYGCLVSQGYGMTETSPTTNTNPLDRIKLESSARPSPIRSRRSSAWTAARSCPPARSASWRCGARR